MTFIDLDGVLVDFVGGVRKVWPGQLPEDNDWPAMQYDIARMLGMKEAEFWEDLEREDDWWGTLEPYPWAEALIDAVEARKERWMVLSSPSRSPFSSSGKVAWMQKFFGSSFRDYVLTPKKNKALLATPGRYLIDDHDGTVQAWNEAGGVGVVFPRPWNSRYNESRHFEEYPRAVQALF